MRGLLYNTRLARARARARARAAVELYSRLRPNVRTRAYKEG